MKSHASTVSLPSVMASVPEGMVCALEPVLEEILQSGTDVLEVMAGQVQPAEEYLDIEGVRFRIARDLNHFVYPGQAELIEQLRALPPERPVRYVVLKLPGRCAKCYVDLEMERLLGVMWQPTADSEPGESGEPSGRV